MRIFLNKKAFTLIEVLGVLAIISILFILIIPNVSSALEKTKETTVLATFKDYKLAIQIFFLDENDFSDDLSNFNEYLSKNLQFENNVSKKQIALAILMLFPLKIITK